MRPPSPELIDRLAAEFVLGTLRGPARRRFDRWLGDSTWPWQAEAVSAVRRWEDRLVGLLASAPPVTPSAEVWSAIERKIQPGRGGAVSRARRWQPWALAASLLLALVGTWWFAGRIRAPGWEVAAELRDTGRRDALWRVEVDADRGRLRLSAVVPYAIDASQAHELWALRDGGAPVSLGLLPQAGAAERTLNEAQRAALLRAQNLAVSLEPTGGSPTGAPTGPVRVVMPLQLGT